MKVAPISRRVARLSLWLILSVLLAVGYGIVNDQITVTLSPEYFSVFKRRQFGPIPDAFGLTNAPTRIQAVAVGAAASWWFGGFLGVTLGAFGLARLSTRGFLRLVLRVIVTTALFSVPFGLAAFLLWPLVRPTPADWPFLTGIGGVRRAWAVGWWHNGAYLGAILGMLAASRRARKGEKRDDDGGEHSNGDGK